MLRHAVPSFLRRRVLLVASSSSSGGQRLAGREPRRSTENIVTGSHFSRIQYQLRYLWYVLSSEKYGRSRCSSRQITKLVKLFRVRRPRTTVYVILRSRFPTWTVHSCISIRKYVYSCLLSFLGLSGTHKRTKVREKSNSSLFPYR